jgi:hypothetical protein
MDVVRWLDQRYGKDGYDLIDLATNYGLVSPDWQTVDRRIETKWTQNRYWAIFIIGGHNVVPHADLPSSVDADTIWTDDPYADFNTDWIPDIPLARLPDGGSYNLIQRQLREHQDSSHSVFAMVNGWFGYVGNFSSNVPTKLVYSPPFDRTQNIPNGVDSGFVYFDLVNSTNPQDPNFNRLWYGWDPYSNNYLAAFSKDDANSQGVVLAVTSYGGLVFGCSAPGCPNIQGFIPLQFLESGARAYIGSTVYNYVFPGLICGEDGICSNSRDYANPEAGMPIFARQFLGSNGMYTPLAAYYLSKVSFLNAATGLKGPYLWKMGHGLVYYGVPDPETECLACVEQAVNPVCPSGNPDDCDGDQLPDSWEHQLVETFKPYLIFHRDDVEFNDGQPPEMYWQVSPGAVEGTNGVWMTMVITYTMDGGISRYEPAGIWDQAKCRLGGCIVGAAISLGNPYACVGGAVLIEEFAEWTNIGALVGKHAGDTEGLRFFLAPDANGNWRITHIDWKRHNHEKFGNPVPQPQCAVEFAGFCYEYGPAYAPDPVTGFSSHPILYVAKDKHAVYGSKEECENATFPLIHERLSSYPTDADCTIKAEICGDPSSGDGFGMLLDSPLDHNVGEREFAVRMTDGSIVLVRFPLMDELVEFPGEYAWETDEFCASLPPIPGFLQAEACGGGMGTKWFPVEGIDR